MLNFLPSTPFGMVGIVPHDIGAKTLPRLKDTIFTDGRSFYEGGRAISPVDYKREALARLEQAAARLPIRVKGDVAWSVVRLDPRHVRVTLIDAGYVNPADRSAEIVLQHLDATRCTNILSGESLPIRGVVTDSGGVQEEAPSLGKPVLVMRDNTERPETVTVGTNELIGTNPANLAPALRRLLAGQWKTGAIPERWDGHAGERIIGILERLLA